MNPTITPAQTATAKAHVRTLTAATAALLDPDASPLEGLGAVQAMFRLFSDLAVIDERAIGSSDAVATVLDSGKAIAPIGAARCVLDLARTRAFLRGLDAAIGEARRRFSGQTVHVLYAGCGPFATLALPLCTRYDAGDVRFTLIDIHRSSIDRARSVAEQLGLGAFIADFICDDAATYRHHEGDPVHVVVAEVMQRALDTEPQLAVTANLAPQLAPGGLFVPQRIAIDIALADLRPRFGDAPETAADSSPIVLRRLFELDAATAPDLIANAAENPASGERSLPSVTVDVPADPLRRAVLLTSIETFEGIGLRQQESGLTMAKILPLDVQHDGVTVEARYVLGSPPGFRIERSTRA